MVPTFSSENSLQACAALQVQNSQPKKCHRAQRKYHVHHQRHPGPIASLHPHPKETVSPTLRNHKYPNPLQVRPCEKFVYLHSFHVLVRPFILCQTLFPMSSSSLAFAPPSTRNEWALLHLSFILIGIITTLLGPILPSFSHRWLLTDAQAGFFFTSQYFFSTLGVVLTSVLLSRFGFAKVSATGFVAFFVGFAFLGLGPWFISVLMVGINGFGYGLTNPAINLRATQLPSTNTAAAVTFLNFSWSIGAVLCPFLVRSMIPSIHLRGFSLLIAACSLLLMVLHLSLRTVPVATHRGPATHPLADWLAHLRMPQAIPLLALFFLYVGTEVALGGWVASYETRFPGMNNITLVVAPSMFYGALLFGRGVAPLALRYLPEILISVGGLLLATFGAALIAAANSPHILYLGAAIAGFGLAPQYPIFVTWMAAIFKQDSTWIGALFFGSAGIGGGALPWLVGIVSAGTHSLRVGLFLPLAVSFLMIFLVLRARPPAELHAS
jgi:MFS transporter, FHS family, glucose/mannose:H+ symporter